MMMLCIQVILAVGVLSIIHYYFYDACPFAIILVWFLLMNIPSSYRRGKSRNTAMKYIRPICEEVVREAPGMDIESWDNITERINELIYLEGDWPSRYCLFDGRNCYEVFRETVVCPYYKSQGNEEGTSDRTESYQDSRDVVVAYKKSLDRWWEHFFKGLNYNNCTKTAHLKLAKSTYFNKLSWTVRLSQQGSFGVSMNQMRPDNANLLLSILMISSLLLFPKFRPLSLYVTVGAVFGIVIGEVTMGFFQFAFARRYLLEAHHRVAWWVLICDINPGEEAENWDLVVRTFNELWGTYNNCFLKKFFFDGEDCKKMFKKMYPKSFLDDHN